MTSFTNVTLTGKGNSNISRSNQLTLGQKKFAYKSQQPMGQLYQHSCASNIAQILTEHLFVLLIFMNLGSAGAQGFINS